LFTLLPFKLCRFPEEFSLSKRPTIAAFARSINYCIPDHLVQLLEKFISSLDLIIIRPHGEVVKYWGMLQKINIYEQMREREQRHLALSKCLNLGVGELPQDCEIQVQILYGHSASSYMVVVYFSPHETSCMVASGSNNFAFSWNRTRNTICSVVPKLY
jgi:hypothetical protein